MTRRSNSALLSTEESVKLGLDTWRQCWNKSKVSGVEFSWNNAVPMWRRILPNLQTSACTANHGRSASVVKVVMSTSLVSVYPPGLADSKEETAKLIHSEAGRLYGWNIRWISIDLDWYSLLALPASPGVCDGIVGGSFEGSISVRRTDNICKK